MNDLTPASFYRQLFKSATQTQC